MSTGATVIDTPEGIEYFRTLQLRAALSIEVRTGMRHSQGSCLAEVNKRYGTSFTRKAAALEFMSGLCDYMSGKSDTLPTVPGMEWDV